MYTWTTYISLHSSSNFKATLFTKKKKNASYSISIYRYSCIFLFLSITHSISPFPYSFPFHGNRKTLFLARKCSLSDSLISKSKRLLSNPSPFRTVNSHKTGVDEIICIFCYLLLAFNLFS